MTRRGRLTCAVGLVAVGASVYRLLATVGEMSADLDERRQQDQQWWDRE
jgi:hypothetical protein